MMKILFENKDEREQFRRNCFKLLATLDNTNPDYREMKQFVSELHDKAEEKI